MRFLMMLFALGVAATIEARAAPFQALVFSRTAAFRHDSIGDGILAIRSLGETNGFSIVATEDSAQFNETNLQHFAVVIFLLTTGDILNPEQQQALENYIARGGGYVGIHSASDTEHSWPWYGELVGAYFSDHPAIQQATVNIVDHDHPSTEFLPATWVRTDEWYNFKSNPRPNVRVLATLDETTYSGGHMGDHPIAWCHEFGGGRAWYTAGGHTRQSYSEPLFRRHVLGGILWAASSYVLQGSPSLQAHFLDEPATYDPLRRTFIVDRPSTARFYRVRGRDSARIRSVELEDSRLVLRLD